MRELFYLGREYAYRSDWIKAVYWLDIYTTRWTYAPELAEVYLLLAHCYWQLQQTDKAKDACLRAIGINANFRAAIELMATMSTGKNEKRWLQFAGTATNEGVVFNRMAKGEHD
ncbi:unnamed protein product [marine sediment metagenome]|uniref:Uncharacterized protein n=1 Tax=marine sediment metagenome TaxID=412755 RepID=X1BAS7_9ZZZZ